MKIGFDARCLMNRNYSGVSWYAYNLLKALLEIDQKNFYQLFYNSSRKKNLPDISAPNLSQSHYRWPNKLFNLSVNLFNQPKLDKLLGGVDIFFVPNLHFIAWSKKCRKVITVHDLSFLRFPEFFTLKMRLWHQLILRKDILGQADMIIADSISTKNDLKELLHIPEEKIRVVYLGVEKKYFEICNRERLDSVSKKYNLPQRFILSLGTLEPRKNLAGVIDAYNQSTVDLNLVIAGGGGWKNRSLRSNASSNKKINFVGYIDEADKPALYQLASLFIYPSFYEGFGLPILEAMASGCPVICGSNSSQLEAAGGAALLVNPYNLAEIKFAINEITSNDDFRQQLIGWGREQAGKFSWKSTAKEMLSIFENINLNNIK